MTVTVLFIGFVLVVFTLVYFSMQRLQRRSATQRATRMAPVVVHFGPVATGDSPPSWTSGPFTVATVAMQQTDATASAVAEGVASPPLKGGGGAMQRSSSYSLDPVLDTREENGATDIDQ